jgi:two-component system, chemotaxis family, chemotaxis protein CheY
MPAAAKLVTGVVDDQAAMRGLVQVTLNQIGIMEVRQYADGAGALEKLRQQPVHVLFSDYNMPGMDGLELLRQIRAEPAFAKMAFVLLTGRADKELVQRAVQLGANNYLVKPFTAAQIKQKLEQVVGPLT